MARSISADFGENPGFNAKAVHAKYAYHPSIEDNSVVSGLAARKSIVTAATLVAFYDIGLEPKEAASIQWSKVRRPLDPTVEESIELITIPIKESTLALLHRRVGVDETPEDVAARILERDLMVGLTAQEPPKPSYFNGQLEVTNGELSRRDSLLYLAAYRGLNSKMFNNERRRWIERGYGDFHLGPRQFMWDRANAVSKGFRVGSGSFELDGNKTVCDLARELNSAVAVANAVAIVAPNSTLGRQRQLFCDSVEYGADSVGARAASLFGVSRSTIAALALVINEIDQSGILDVDIHGGFTFS